MGSHKDFKVGRSGSGGEFTDVEVFPLGHCSPILVALQKQLMQETPVNPTDGSTDGTSASDNLPSRVREYLRGFASQSAAITYQALANALGLEPPNTIHRLTNALEQLMQQDAAAHRPLIAALVISKRRNGLPAPGFFECAAALDRFSGDAAGPDAAAFHSREFAAAVKFWSKQACPS